MERVLQGVQVNVISYSGCGGRVEGEVWVELVSGLGFGAWGLCDEAEVVIVE